ncbi:carbohydrate ABC transporter permease [Ruminococcus flavefaciens]|uniref:ABC transporter permease n=2 Tax=Ruminococcus flavefaciens TaxID=1265 RepID=W7UQS2_RUMFL|nr:sugar ABC transporter permease [Ruminococcus flavefaciens]EWM53774.1 ABC transporter permease [Ruminococcus flavefaciens 007c]CAB51940.1 Putative ABC-type Sugar Transporter [Ruminococcus flavefaciens 17]
MKTKLKGISYSKYGYLFSIPFIVAFLIFTLYPTIYTATLGFTDCKGVNGPENYHFLDKPFENFKSILENDTFRISLKNTILIWIMNFIPQISIALLLTAWFTSHSNEIRGKGFFKVVFYMPNIITAATVAILFHTLFNYPIGPVNDFLESTGLRESPYYFFTSKTACRIIVAFIQFWTWYGNTMIVLISGVLGISPDIYEAAEIDGANGVQTFFRITIPNLKTVLLYTLITSLVGGLNMFDIPFLFLNGGPDRATTTTSVFIYNQAFAGSYLYNKAAAASMIMWVIIALCSAVLFFVMRDKDQIKLEKEIKRAKKEAKLASKGGVNQWQW